MPELSPFKFKHADESAGFLLWKITSLWQARLSAVLGEFGITQTQYAMMASLMWFERKQEPPTQAHLVEHAKVDKMTVSKAIRRLEDDGLVLRVDSSTDSRATNVSFTARGRKIVQAAIVAIENADEKFFAGLTGKQLEVYKSLTAAVIAGNEP